MEIHLLQSLSAWVFDIEMQVRGPQHQRADSSLPEGLQLTSDFLSRTFRGGRVESKLPYFWLSKDVRQKYCSLVPEGSGWESPWGGPGKVARIGLLSRSGSGCAPRPTLEGIVFFPARTRAPPLAGTDVPLIRGRVRGVKGWYEQSALKNTLFQSRLPSHKTHTYLLLAPCPRLFLHPIILLVLQLTY